MIRNLKLIEQAIDRALDYIETGQTWKAKEELELLKGKRSDHGQQCNDSEGPGAA